MSKIQSFENLSSNTNISHAISTKAFGSMKNHENAIDCDNLEHFRNAINMPERAVCMQQVHGGNVKIIDNNKQLVIPDVDGLITNKKNVPLCVVTADCLPVLFYDSKKQVIGVAHAGYKGLLKHILQNTLNQFKKEFQSNPKDIKVGIGPCIEMMCYEVGEEVVKQFEKEFPTFKNMYTKRQGKYFLDLRNIAFQSLVEEGVPKKNISIAKTCTKCTIDMFYSYRRGDKTGRFASVISLV